MAILNTNEFSSIQAALDVAMNTGDSIYIPSGEHIISDTLFVRGKNRIIFGDGQNNTIIKLNVAGKDIMNVEEGLDYLKLSQFTLTRNSISTTNDGLVLEGQNHNAIFEQIQIQKSKIGFNSKYLSWMQHYIQCRTDSCQEIGFYTNGLNSSGGGAGTTIFYNQCYANDCKTGFQFENIKQVTLISCAIDHFVDKGVSGVNIGNLLIQNLHSEANTLEENASLVEFIGTPSHQLIIDGLNMESSSVLNGNAYAVRISHTNSTAYLRGISGYNNNSIRLYDIKEFSGQNGEYHIFRNTGFQPGIASLENGRIITTVRYGRNTVAAGGVFNTGLGKKPESVLISINEEEGSNPTTPSVVAQIVDYFSNGDVKIRYVKISNGSQDFGTYNLSWAAW